MENDVLKNKIAPWQEKGRWYHGVWDYSISDFDHDKSDPILYDTSLFQLTTDGSSNYVLYPLVKNGKRYSIIDVKYKSDDDIVCSQNTNSYIGAIRTTSLGATGRIFARALNVTGGHADIWLFMDIVDQ